MIISDSHRQKIVAYLKGKEEIYVVDFYMYSAFPLRHEVVCVPIPN
jgi:hypothetical protein